MHVISKLNIVTNIMNRIRPRRGSRNKFSLKLPEVHKHSKHNNEVTCKYKEYKVKHDRRLIQRILSLVTHH